MNPALRFPAVGLHLKRASFKEVDHLTVTIKDLRVIEVITRYPSSRDTGRKSFSDNGLS